MELAQIDATLDEIDDRRARNRHDAELYADERGGDVRRMLVCPLRGLYDEASSSEEEEAAEGDGEARAAAAARAAARQAGRETVAEAARGSRDPSTQAHMHTVSLSLVFGHNRHIVGGHW